MYICFLKNLHIYTYFYLYFVPVANPQIKFNKCLSASCLSLFLSALSVSSPPSPSPSSSSSGLQSVTITSVRQALSLLASQRRSPASCFYIPMVPSLCDCCSVALQLPFCIMKKLLKKEGFWGGEMRGCKVGKTTQWHSCVGRGLLCWERPSPRRSSSNTASFLQRAERFMKAVTRPPGSAYLFNRKVKPKVSKQAVNRGLIVLFVGEL